jgi:hypothetical protein
LLLLFFFQKEKKKKELRRKTKKSAERKKETHYTYDDQTQRKGIPHEPLSLSLSYSRSEASTQPKKSLTDVFSWS